jgi:hypothetical protein
MKAITAFVIFLFAVMALFVIAAIIVELFKKYNNEEDN